MIQSSRTSAQNASSAGDPPKKGAKVYYVRNDPPLDSVENVSEKVWLLLMALLQRQPMQKALIKKEVGCVEHLSDVH